MQRGDDRVRIRRATGTAPQEYVLPHVAPVVGPLVGSMTHVAQPQPHTPAVVAPSHPAPHAPAVNEAERVYVGKKKSAHAFSQEEICEMLIERARRALTVVRLKGGDPFLFGRGGEEAEALAEAGIPFEIVPGVTSPLGIAAYTGVPRSAR